MDAREEDVAQLNDGLLFESKKGWYFVKLQGSGGNKLARSLP